jgi:biopolymer transport protein ExbD
MAISGGGGTGVSGMTSDINVTPMADVMLVLLIIFMITTPLIQSGVAVNMATAKNAEEAPEAKRLKRKQRTRPPSRSRDPVSIM